MSHSYSKKGRALEIPNRIDELPSYIEGFKLIDKARKSSAPYTGDEEGMELKYRFSALSLHLMRVANHTLSLLRIIQRLKAQIADQQLLIITQKTAVENALDALSSDRGGERSALDAVLEAQNILEGLND